MSNLEFDKKPPEFVLEGFKPYGLIPKLKVRLKDFPDSEPAQAILRIVILACLTLIFAGASFTEGKVSTLEILLGTYLLIAIAIFASIAISVKPWPARRIFANLLDVTYTSICMILSPYSGGFLYWVYLFVTIGNGYRFGQRYLFISQVLSLFGFAVVCFMVPRYFNAENFWQTLGMFTGLILIPTYVRNFHTREERIRAKLIEARHNADSANAAKSRFLAMMSHEMRTPLNGVHGSCELLAETPLTREQSSWVSIARNCSATLLGLINNVLDLSKVEAGKVTLEQHYFDLHSLVDSVVAVFEPQLVGKSVRLVTVIDPKLDYALTGDEQRLKQVLINLVGNAVKFTQAGEVVLQIDQTKDTADDVSIKFTVIDSGIGIPDDKQDRIFQSFTQADDSTTRRYGGTGLGTTIAKQIVEIMGGELLLVSAPNKGSIFWFEIRLLKSPLAVRESIHQAFTEGKILLVNFADDEVVRLREIIRTWGLRADTAESLANAYSRLGVTDKVAHPYGAVLINARSLNADVLTVAAEIKRDGSNAATKLLLANQDCSSHTRIKLSKAGFNTLMDSPFETRSLFNALHSVQSAWAQHKSGSVVPLLSRAKLTEDRPEHKVRILLADDVDTNQKVMSAMLTNAGYSVDVVSDGEQALDQLEKFHYDIAMLDLRMPVMSGVEAVKFYKFTKPKNPPKFILLTADVLNDIQEEALSAGIVEIVYKPVQAATLIDVVRRWAPSVDTSARPDMPELARRQPPTVEFGAADVLLSEDVMEELANLSDDPTFVESLIKGYISDGENLIHEFANLLREYEKSRDRGQLAKIAELAHALKGNSAQMGLIKLSRLAAELQKTSLETLSTAGGELHKKLRWLFDQSVQELNLRASSRRKQAR